MCPPLSGVNVGNSSKDINISVLSLTCIYFAMMLQTVRSPKWSFVCFLVEFSLFCLCTIYWKILSTLMLSELFKVAYQI